jgi:hypothetical protein
MFSLTRPGRRARRPARTLSRPLSLEDRTVPAVFSFSTGSPDGLMAVASHQAGLTPETEAADDFILSTETTLTETSFTGLVPTTTTPGSYLDVTVEIYRVFPSDSDPLRTIRVPTRANSPSDVAFTSRDFKAGGLSFGFEELSPSFTAANSVVSGIHASPHQTTGGDGAVTGTEVQIEVAYSLGLDLPAGHYFIVPQVKLRHGTFEWLSAPSKQFTGDLQAWVRNSHLDPDWLRVGTDIVGGTVPPTVDASFSLLGNTVTQTFAFSTGGPDGLMATASHPAGLTPETESADDFILSAGTVLTQGTFTGLLPTGFKPTDITNVDIEIYRVFPDDSDLVRPIRVPTRANSPADVAFTTRDARKGGLAYGFEVLNPNFTATSSVVSGIHPSPKQTTGGDGPVTGEEVQFEFSFSPGLYLPAGHYFFVPQVKLRRGTFEWLSTPSNQFTGDLQEWIRNSHLDPDWLRVGTDIVGGTTPPKFNAAFSLAGRAP